MFFDSEPSRKKQQMLLNYAMMDVDLDLSLGKSK